MGSDVASGGGAVGDAPRVEAVDVLLDDPCFFEPFPRWFDPTFGPPSILMETYLRLSFLKYRYQLG